MEYTKATKNEKGGKKMTNFDEYVAVMEQRRDREKLARMNAELQRRLRERTHEDTLAALFSSLRFTVGVADILPETIEAKSASLREYVR